MSTAMERTCAVTIAWALIAGGLTGCPDQSGPSFDEAVREVYKPCDADALKARVAQYGLQLAFDACGSNNFRHFTWAADGEQLYYHTYNGPWVTNPNVGTNQPIRSSAPLTNAVWINDDLLSFAAPGQRGINIEVYSVARNVLNIVPTRFERVVTVQKGAGADELLILGVLPESAAGAPTNWEEAGEGGTGSTLPASMRPARIHTLGLNDGRLEQAFPWLESDVQDFTYQAEQDLLSWRAAGEDSIRIHQGASGEELHRFENRTRASSSRDGRWLVLEGLGEAIPLFRIAEAVTPDADGEEGAEAAEPAEAAETAEAAEAAQGAEGAEASPVPETTEAPTLAAGQVPSYLPQTVQPPALWIYDRTTGEQVQLPGIYGDKWGWYDHSPYFGSFMLWGVSDRELNRNVTFMDVGAALRGLGVEVPELEGWPAQ